MGPKTVKIASSALLNLTESKATPQPRGRSESSAKRDRTTRTSVIPPEEDNPNTGKLPRQTGDNLKK